MPRREHMILWIQSVSKVLCKFGGSSLIVWVVFCWYFQGPLVKQVVTYTDLVAEHLPSFILAIFPAGDELLQ